MIKVRELFDVYYGANLELNALEFDKDGINFVSRTSKNNGVSAKVKELPGVVPIPAGTISVAAGGSVMESFLQLQPYYSGRDILYLVAKEKLSNELKLYCCVCLRLNQFKYSFGRQANATIRDLLIPSLEEIPVWARDFSIKTYAMQLLNQIKLDMPEAIVKNKVSDNLILLSELFTPINGVASSKVKRVSEKIDESYVPYIRPSYRQNTSIDGFVLRNTVDNKHIFPKDTLYVSTDGQGSHTHAYVSVFEFVPNSNVSVLIPKREMHLQEKLYYAQCITNNRYKFSYGRKPKGNRLKSILLPEYPPQPIVSYDIDKIIKEFSDVVYKLSSPVG